ncbi:hypothetical protein I7I48_08948 [Histoplasma ohiense]|nr:hypothetical protein I7I48_08948 [Histoplasma ohiense (nom. inval.)]
MPPTIIYETVYSEQRNNITRSTRIEMGLEGHKIPTSNYSHILARASVAQVTNYARDTSSNLALLLFITALPSPTTNYLAAPPSPSRAAPTNTPSHTPAAEKNVVTSATRFSLYSSNADE